MSKLTLIGMFNMMGGYDENNGLFSEIKSTQVPTNIPIDLDAPLPPSEAAKLIRNSIIDSILDRGGEFETLYADPDYMRYFIGRTYARWNRTFKKWADALEVSYDPLNNYDRTEETTRKNTGTQKNERSNEGYQTINSVNGGYELTLSTDGGSQTVKEENTGTQTIDVEESGEDTNSGSSGPRAGTADGTKTTVFKSAYNTPDLVEDTMTDVVSEPGVITDTEGTIEYGHKTENVRTDDYDKTITTTGGLTKNIRRDDALTKNDRRDDHLTQDDLRTDDLTEHISTRTFGNIGVTTSQQMLQSELEIARFNLLNQIADVLIQELCILVY